MNDVLRSVMQDRRKLAVVAGLLLLLAAVIAFVVMGAGEAQPAAAGPLVEEPDEVDEEPEPEVEPTPVGLGVLTGAPVYDEEALTRPVVATKIENSEAARPQSGLEQADVVFEELVEGGVTRFLALYQSEVPERVGPIRSARPEDASVLPAYDAMLYMSGARAEVVDMLRSAGVNAIREDGTVMRRDPSRRAPHNVYAAGDTMFSYASSRVGEPQPSGFTFSETVPDGATRCADPCEQEPGEELSVALSRVAVTGFEYDEDAGVYRRFQNGAPQVVTGDGQVGADNVVVLGTRVGDGGCCDSAGNRYTATILQGEGAAVVYRDGKRFDARWSKPSANAHFTLTTDDGRVLDLKPGRSWVLFAPASALP